MVPWDMLAHSLGITISSDADVANQETTLGCLAVFCLFSPKNLQEVKKKKSTRRKTLKTCTASREDSFFLWTHVLRRRSIKMKLLKSNSLETVVCVCACGSACLLADAHTPAVFVGKISMCLFAVV